MDDSTQNELTAPAEVAAPDRELLGTATYSPEDNKLRLYPFARLARSDYDRVRAAGFIWAGKQELFVAPMWTPAREDLLIELCGEVGDEDKSLVDRAEERSERFETYSDKRADDATRARDAVAAIADGIPFGQPILVGHHSERHARKDAERIENGMRKAVRMWETSKYWTDRAAGAMRAAKYKELPGVRARRIKGIEADARKRQREMDQAIGQQMAWEKIAGIADGEQQLKAAILLAGNSDAGWLALPRKEGDRVDWDQSCRAYEGLTNHYPSLYAQRTVAEVVAAAREVYPRSVQHGARWVAHYENRLAYEKAMLEEQGASHLIAPTKRPAVLPLLNYRQAEIVINSPWEAGKKETLKQVEMTADDFKGIYDQQRGTRIVDGTHRIRFALVQFVNGKPARFPSHQSPWCAVFLTDSKTHAKPSADAPKPAPAPSAGERLDERIAEARSILPPRAEPKPEAAEFAAMKESLRAGVKVVSAPQLFPTPAPLARRMVQLADLSTPDLRVLEPSAGTGNLLRAIHARGFSGEVVAVELSVPMASVLQRSGLARTVIQGDFLERNGDIGKFDRVVMNPPFADSVDIRHIRHALEMLKPGGKLVAICAGGPRQERELQPIADTWEALPDGTFASQGTNVRTVLATFTA